MDKSGGVKWEKEEKEEKGGENRGGDRHVGVEGGAAAKEGRPLRVSYWHHQSPSVKNLNEKRFVYAHLLSSLSRSGENRKRNRVVWNVSGESK